MSPNSYQCPNCAAPLDAGVRACEACGMRLAGPDYERLWSVLTQIRTLQTEADRLKRVLLVQPGTVPAAAGDAPPLQPTTAAPARPGLSGQQVLLGLGALLVLAASSIFLLAVWFLVGIAGQALIMAGLTALAVQGGRLAARRGLDAAAETGAVIATGMALLDVLGARRFGLFGLDELSPDRFGALATALVGALLLGFHSLAPRTTSQGDPARLPLTYLPVAAVLFAATPWFLFLEAEPTLPSLAFLAGVLGVAVAQAGTAAGFWLFSGRRTTLPAMGLAGAAAVAYGIHLFVGFGIAHDIENSTALRYGALAFLVVPLAVLLHPTARRLVPEVVLVALALVLVTVPVADLPGWAVVVAAAATAAGLAALVAGAASSVRTSGAAVLLWMLAGTGLVLSLSGADTLHLVDAAPATPTSWPELVTGLVPLGLVAAVALWATLRGREVAWMLQAQVAVLAFTGRALLETGEQERWWLVAVALAVVEGALATYAAGRRAAGPRSGPWPVIEVAALFFGGVYGAVATVAATELDAYWFAATCFTAGVVLIGYATSPGRFGVAYLGVLANALGGWVLTAEAGVETIEAYSFPLAAMLAVLGYLHWRRDPGLPTRITLGPVLGVLLGPSLLVAVLEGDTPRLALVTLGGTVSLLVGYARGWQAPVTSGIVVLGVIGITQGGPYVAQIPGWITLGLGGVLLLVVGVRWEVAVTTGRRGAAWFGSLA